MTTSFPVPRPARGRRAVLVALLALVVVAPLAAQQWAGRGRMSGSVKDDAGNPLKARVTLRRDGMGPDPIETDDKGKWSYLGLANGTWGVLVEAPGFVPAEGTIAVSEFSFNPPVNMELRKVPKEQQIAAEGNEALKRITEGNEALAGGRPAEARVAFEAALLLLEAPNHPPVLRGIAQATYQEGNVDGAIAALERSLALEPTDEETLRLAVNLLVASGREAEAQTYMARLPEGTKIEPETLLNMGIKAYNDGDGAGAVKSFDQVVQQNPDMPDAYYYRGLAYLNMGDKNAEALADFEKMLALQPDSERAAEVQQFIEYLKSQTK